MTRRAAGSGPGGPAGDAASAWLALVAASIVGRRSQSLQGCSTCSRLAGDDEWLRAAFGEVSGRASRARRSRTIVEVMAGIGLLTVLILGVAPAAWLGSARQSALAGWIEDLEAGTRMADRLGVELREARRVVVKGPGGARSGAGALLLMRPGGELVLLELERPRADLPGWLIRTRFDARGAPLVRERLVALDGLAFRYEQRPGLGVVGVAFDLTLPRRQAGAAPAVLSSYALVGAGEASR